MRRIAYAAGLTAAAALAASAVSLVAEEPPSVAAPTASSDGGLRREISRTSGLAKAEEELELARLRLREGTRLHDVAGSFRQSGDSLTFVDGEGREIAGLPNLNLERILRMLKTVEEPESVTWSVSGLITEFSGRNFLLISRAVYKASAPPPAPESLTQTEASPPAPETPGQ